MNQPPLNISSIETSVRPITKQEYENHYNRLAFDASPLDEPMEDMPEEKGDGISTFRQRHYQTTKRLEGDAMKLNSQSIVRYQDFEVPLEVTRENCENFLYKRELATVCFALVRITEPGIMCRVNEDAIGMIIRTEEPVEHQAFLGMMHVLNGTALDQDSFDAILTSFRTAQYHMIDIRKDESSHVNELLSGLDFNSPE